MMDFIRDPSLVLCLPLRKRDGSPFMSDDAYGHTCTVTGATWGLQGRTFAANQYIELASDGVATSPLNFTSGDFSIVLGIKTTDLTGVNQLFCRGLVSTDGYYAEVRADGLLRFVTNQAGAAQSSDSTAGDITINNWFTAGFSRVGAAATIYKNGVDVTAVSGTHVNPLTSSKTTKIGIWDDKAANDFIGTMNFVAIYSKALGALEHLDIHNLAKWRYA